MQLIFAILFLLASLASWAAVIAYMPFGIPLGFLFLAFSIWFFAAWRYAKHISMSTGVQLLMLPILGVLPLLTANRDLFGLERFSTVPPAQASSLLFLLGLLDGFILPLLWWAAVIFVIIHFLRTVRES